MIPLVKITVKLLGRTAKRMDIIKTVKEYLAMSDDEKKDYEFWNRTEMAVIRKYLYYTEHHPEISQDDLLAICENTIDWCDRIDEIAEECEEEGHPSCGSNYEIRVEMERGDYKYIENKILEKYGIFE